ncbi:hypothetical protein EQG41_20425 [Billgrantia azerbaijanica]|nr:hypothetical protein EQG41_20425 [Halomonas azerbaijanica]
MATIDTNSLKVRIDEGMLRDLRRDLSHIKNGSNKAMSRAINHTLGVTRTEASTQIRKQVKLKAGYVRERLKIRKATVNKLQGAIRTPSRGVLLSRFPNRAYKRGGIGVQVKPSGGKKRMPGAFFIGPLKNSGVMAIAIRTQHGPGLGRSGGLKITYGPSVSQVFTDVKDDLQAPSGNRLMQRLAYEADRLLKRQ